MEGQLSAGWTPQASAAFESFEWSIEHEIWHQLWVLEVSIIWVTEFGFKSECYHDCACHWYTPLIITLSKINKDRWLESVNGHILFHFGPKIFHVFCSLFNYSSANRHALALVWRNGNCPRCHLSQLLQCFTSVSQSPWQTSTSFIIMYTGWEVYRLNLKRNYFGKVDLASTDLGSNKCTFLLKISWRSSNIMRIFMGLALQLF